jgi:hypothetical protein
MTRARSAYDAFFTLWKDADDDITGCVAKTILSANRSNWRVSPVSMIQLQSEGFLDELNLANDILFWQPSHLAFPDHVQNLVALNRAPRSIERFENLGWH